VCLDGDFGNAELDGDELVQKTLNDQGQHVALAPAERGIALAVEVEPGLEAQRDPAPSLADWI